MNATSTISIAAVLSLSFAAARPARAAEKENAWAKTQGHRVGLELDLLSKSISRRMSDVQADVSTLGLGFALVGQIRLRDRLYIDLDVPFAYGSVSSTLDAEELGIDQTTSTGGFIFGNPTLGAHYGRALFKRLTVFAGAALSIPTLLDPDDATRAAVQANDRARAFFDIHRFFPEHVTLRMRGGMEARLTDPLLYRADSTFLMALPTGGGTTEIVIEQGNELEYRRKSGIGGGLRLQAAFTLTEGDLVQTALEPFFSYEPAAPDLYARAGLLVALDKQLGFGFDQDKIATLRFAVGGKF